MNDSLTQLQKLTHEEAIVHVYVNSTFTHFNTLFHAQAQQECDRNGSDFDTM